jgi:hypothetical protein
MWDLHWINAYYSVSSGIQRRGSFHRDVSSICWVMMRGIGAFECILMIYCDCLCDTYDDDDDDDDDCKAAH